MLTRDRVCELFDYDPATGDLIRRVAKANQPAGAVAGSVNAKGHLNVQVDGRLYAAHRLVFLMHHGWLPREIDHENRIKTDNRIGNLRPCSRSQNTGNVGLRSINITGFKGIWFAKHANRWRAAIKVHGVSKHLGYFDTPEAAALAYDKAASVHYGDFAHLNQTS